MRLSIITWILALLVLLAGLSGCAKEQPATPTQTAPTTSSSTTTPAPSEPQEEKISYDHCGLSFKLGSSFTAAPSAEDKNVFVFENEEISGSIRFGARSELGNGAESSEAYAQALKAQHGEGDAWIGSSTGISHYLVSKTESGSRIQCLYIYEQVCWLVEAEGDSSLTEQLIQIAGRCGWNAENIPEL